MSSGDGDENKTARVIIQCKECIRCERRRKRREEESEWRHKRIRGLFRSCSLGETYLITVEANAIQPTTTYERIGV